MPLLAKATVMRVALSMAHSANTSLSTAKAATIMMRGTLVAKSVRRHSSYLVIRVVIQESLTRSILRTSGLGTSQSTVIMIASAFITMSTI